MLRRRARCTERERKKLGDVHTTPSSITSNENRKAEHPACDGLVSLGISQFDCGATVLLQQVNQEIAGLGELKAFSVHLQGVGYVWLPPRGMADEPAPSSQHSEWTAASLSKHLHAPASVWKLSPRLHAKNVPVVSARGLDKERRGSAQ